MYIYTSFSLKCKQTQKSLVHEDHLATDAHVAKHLSFYVLFIAVNNPYNNQLYLCAALPDNILLMQWYEPMGKFMKVNVS